jgi:RNA polymerase sigma-70 factor (ECF subfamily)
LDLIDLDYSLLRKTARGDQRAFAELMRRHQGRVFRLALKLLRDQQDAEDAAQEVFLKAYEYADRFKPTGTVAAWLNRITANYCLNRLRSRFPRKELSFSVLGPTSGGPSPVESLRSASPTPLESLEEQELARRLQQALDALPEKQRQALILKRFGDFSYQEIATLLGLSPAAVDGLIKRARNNLKKALPDYF